MTVQTHAAMDQPSPPRAKRSRALLWVALFAGTVLAAVLAGLILEVRSGSAVCYQGRAIQSWFVDLAKSDWSSYSMDIRTNPPAIAFLDMEGDALPFLADRCTWGWSPLQSAYASLYQRLPRGLRGRLSAPRPDPRHLALWMLGAIGQEQEKKKWQGKPSPKLSVAAAMPAIRKTLWNSDLRYRAYSTINQCGSSAYPLIPDLIRLAEADYASHRVDGTAVRLLGEMGPAASNAVPFLRTIASDPDQKSTYHLAVRALGDIGPPASAAAPLIASHLVEEGPSSDLVSVMALARIGVTPPAAVPVLRKALNQSAPLCQVYSMIALWNQEPANPDLQARIDALLVAPLVTNLTPRNAREVDARFLAGPLLATLRLRGSQAAVFAPAVRRLVEAGDPALTNLATLCLQAIAPRVRTE